MFKLLFQNLTKPLILLNFIYVDVTKMYEKA